MPSDTVARSRLKLEIQKRFKLHGYQLRPDGCRYLEDILSDLDDPELWSSWLDKILAALQKRELESCFLGKDILTKAVQDCSCEESGEQVENIFTVIDAFTVPRLSYSVDRKKFVLDTTTSVADPVFADASAKCQLFLDRYSTILQRVNRHHLFAPQMAGADCQDESSGGERKYQLLTVDYLLGTVERLGNVVILGLLVQHKQNQYALEDPTGIVKLDLSEARFHKGLYTENCYVLVEGWYEDLVCHVTALGHPPIEKPDLSRPAFGSVNYFGGPLETSAKCNARLIHLENSDDNAMIVFVSDVWLDQPSVVENLNRLLQGYSVIPPTAFVLMGNFMSNTQTLSQVQAADALREHLAGLADMISEFPSLMLQSKFIFVPGPCDPGFPLIYPRPGLPSYITEAFFKKVPNCVFASNPVRIQYCTHEIVVFREDIVTKMCRNCVYFPENEDVPAHFARSILSQSHLAPLPLHMMPVYWRYDRAMWLYPLPDVVVCGDKFDPFTVSQDSCMVINPGSFMKNAFAFKTYIPKLRQVDDSQVPNEEQP